MKLEYVGKPGSKGVVLTEISKKLPGFKVFFSTRVAVEKTGPLFVNYGFYGLSGAVSARRNICEALGLDFKRLTLGEQVHSVNVAVIKEENIGAGAENPETRIPETDALVTSEKNAPIAICTADCVPILLA
ncbi:MAG TPA: laccase domain-containing protein, partial [bacterium]|nr:laccase domain-containing protein [bacterium]